MINGSPHRCGLPLAAPGGRFRSSACAWLEHSNIYRVIDKPGVNRDRRSKWPSLEADRSGARFHLGLLLVPEQIPRVNLPSIPVVELPTVLHAIRLRGSFVNVRRRGDSIGASTGYRRHSYHCGRNQHCSPSSHKRSSYEARDPVRVGKLTRDLHAPQSSRIPYPPVWPQPMSAGYAQPVPFSLLRVFTVAAAVHPNGAERV